MKTVTLILALMATINGHQEPPLAPDVVKSKLLESALPPSATLSINDSRRCGGSTLYVYNVAQESTFLDKPRKIFIGAVGPKGQGAIEITSVYDIAGEAPGTFYAVSANINILETEPSCIAHANVSVSIAGSGAMAESTDVLVDFDGRSIISLHKYGITGTRVKLSLDDLKCDNAKLSYALLEGSSLAVRFAKSGSNNEPETLAYSSMGKSIQTRPESASSPDWHPLKRNFDDFCKLASNNRSGDK